MYDVAVVGAGPAGSAAAIAAAQRGARVLLLDRHTFPRDKACGDGIAPHALDVLESLGVIGVTEGFAPVDVLRLDSPAGVSAQRRMSRAAHVIPRAVFDARLVAAAVAAGAELRQATVRDVAIGSGFVEVAGHRARVLIGADGAQSAVRRFLGMTPNPPGHLAIAIRGYASQPPDAPPIQHLALANEHWPAYAWSFPIGNGERNVGYGEMITGSPVSRAHLLDRMSTLLGDLGVARDLKAHYLPLSTHRPPPGRGPILLAGDALSLINPFTGEGIYYALVSGVLAGEAAVIGGSSAALHYARALRGRLGRHLRHTTLTARLAAMPSLADAGIRAAARDQRVFDSFVELGLGSGLLDLRLLAAVARAFAGPRRG